MPTQMKSVKGHNGHLWQMDGHRVQRCDSTTGHSVRDVALCSSDRIAAQLLGALAAKEALATLLHCAAIPDEWAEPARQALARADCAGN